MRMKEAIVVLMAMLLVVPVVAQEKQISFGVKGGINMANLAFDPELPESMESSTLMGLAFGGVLGFNLSPAASLDMEVMYLQKGASWEETDGDCTGETDIKLAYIALSPMLRFKIHSESLTPYFMAGGEIGMLMSANAEGTWECDGESGETDVDVKDSYKDIDFGVSFGAGVEFPMGNSALFVEARYAMGLSDIGEDADDTELLQEDDDDATVKNKGIYLFGGLRF